MSILIIDNHSASLLELIDSFPVAPTVISKENFDDGIDLKPYNLIVLSGGSHMPTVLHHPEHYAKEMELIKTSSIPLLGICLGAEIIATAFGSTLKKLEHKHIGHVSLTIDDDTLKKDLDAKEVNFFEAHGIGIAKLPDCLIACAHSDHGIEIYRHAQKSIIGLQFHPEIDKNHALFAWIFETLGL